MLSKLYKILVRINILYWLAVKIRNQLNIFIGFRFASSHNIYQNGEENLINRLGEIYTFIDVGANVGDWSDMVLNKQKSIIRKGYLIEPGIAAFNILKNKYSNRNDIQILNIALGDKNENMTFYEEENAGETSSLVPNFSYQKSKLIEVKMITLDQLIEEEKIEHIDLIKIDCEGYDLKVLEGARETLRKKKISNIQFEYGDGWLLAGSTLTCAHQLLNGYYFYYLDGDNLKQMPSLWPGDYFRYSNFVASLNKLIP